MADLPRRYGVVSYGSHAWEIQDLATGEHVCVVGLPEATSYQNRRSNEARTDPRPKTLARARALAAQLERALEVADV